MDLIIPVFQSIFAGWIVLIVIKYIAFNKIHRFIGKYSHYPLKDDQITFTLKYNKRNLFNPILNIPIEIDRYKEGDSQNWSGTFNSDILNAYYFKGQYIIKEPGVHDKDGWHEVYLFEKAPRKLIAFNLHYLNENNRWVVDEGYYIEKNKK